MEARKIIGDIRKLVGVGGYQTKLCKVVSVEDDNTCTVEAYSGEQYEKVTINAEITKNKGIFITPKVDSSVLITMKDEIHGFISQFSDIDKFVIKIQDFDLELKDGNVKIKGKKVEAEFDQITFNGGENAGLVKVKELTDKINELVDWCKDHTHMIPVINTTGSPTAQVANNVDVPKPLSPPQRLNIRDYENDTIKH